MLINERDYLAHIGTPRRSGRYPWGSGGDDSNTTRNMSFLDSVAYLKTQGLSDVTIAKGMKMNTSQLRAQKSIQKNAIKQADINMARRLSDKGMSPRAIGVRMARNGVPRNESSIRALLEPGAKDKADQLTQIVTMIKDAVDTQGFVQVGLGVENRIGVSKDKLKIAVAVLREKGYAYHNVQTPQLGTSVGNMTTIKVIAPPGTKYLDVKLNLDKIHNIGEYSTDGGRSSLGIVAPLQVDSKRIGIRYAKDGGGAEDGVIYVRPGIKDLSMGASRYAQVRIAVDGTHYLKGMAMYKDGLPRGVDLVFNTNKDSTGNKLDAMKPIDAKNPENPFTSMLSRQITVKDKNGKDVCTSAINMVNEEGSWSEWSNSLSSQMLSKQPPALAREQLAKKLDDKLAVLDEYRSLTNPSVRKKLLETFADGADSSALHLDAKAIVGQGNHIILPVNSLKENEIYAPNFNNGEHVVLIRHPHAGPFEIPELTVNNKHPESKRLLGDAIDAVGINSAVAKRLSGADFDGDTVLVIPNNNRKIQSKPALVALEHFDPQHEYPYYDGMKVMTHANKGVEMGKISNLITDMTIKKAPLDELARAVKHSMVVIDSEKHDLDYISSALDNNIGDLKIKYQKPYRGASTLISRAKSRAMIPIQEPRKAKEGGPIDPKTGKKIFIPTGETYPKNKVTIDAVTGEKIYTPTGKIVVRKQRSQKMIETQDAFTLSSGTLMESIYATHANRLKDLANQARKEALHTAPLKYQPSARIAYDNEVKSLNHKLSIALSNKPLEKQAQAIAFMNVKAIMQANRDMTDEEIKKTNYRALREARHRTGAGKEPVEITDNEWEAIQAGAITPNKLHDILNNANLDDIKKRAMPRVKPIMTSAKQSRARSMLARGATRAEVAGALGVSLTTLRTSLSSEGGE